MVPLTLQGRIVSASNMPSCKAKCASITVGRLRSNGPISRKPWRRFAGCPLFALALALIHCAVTLPAVAAPPSEPFVVYFDFGRTDLGPNAQRILMEVAERYLNAGNGRQILVSAFTDNAEASETLAKARGEAIRSTLAQFGIPRNVIVVFAYGNQKPAVRTAPRAKEALNRRAEIVVR